MLKKELIECYRPSQCRKRGVPPGATQTRGMNGRRRKLMRRSFNPKLATAAVLKPIAALYIKDVVIKVISIFLLKGLF